MVEKTRKIHDFQTFEEIKGVHRADMKFEGFKDDFPIGQNRELIKKCGYEKYFVRKIERFTEDDFEKHRDAILYELKALMTLDSPYFIRVEAMKKRIDFAKSQTYISYEGAYEYINGPTLEELLKIRGGTLSEPNALVIV